MPDKSQSDEPLTVSVPKAGKMLGFGRDAAYQAAKTGELPVIKFGNRQRVSTAVIKRMLEGKSI